MKKPNQKNRIMEYRSRNIQMVILLLLLTLSAKAQVFEKQKNISKSFAVTKDCNIQVSNKYGDIHIVPWDKDSAYFSIDIKVTDKKEADAEKILNAIDVDFTNTSYFLIGKTVFRDSKSQVLSDLSDMANSLFNISKNVEIKYIIYVPQTASLKIDNKFGNIYTTNHSGNIDITLSNGDLKANDLNGSETKIELSFGNAVVNFIKNGKLNIGYSDFELKNAGKLLVEGRSAKMNINKVENIDLNSKRDKYYIDTVTSVTGKTDFSYLDIYYLKESINLETVYGDINLTEIDKSFKYLNLNSEYTDIILYFQKSSAVSLDLSCKKTELSYSPLFTGFQKQVINEKTSEYKATGTLGTETDTKSPVRINAVSGSISVNTK
jgi:hypothetical protein